MSSVTTHVLNTAKGEPGKGIQVTLDIKQEDRFENIGSGTTDEDGRVKDLLANDHQLKTGIYRISFDTGSYYKAQGEKCFYPEASIVFEVEIESEHYHVPLLISGFGYSTYRGS